ncbi:MAG: GAF domain-containing protein [Anaerolineales bacterium]|nr:GAF domain-containing protein [Anaerolineales bacterium]
MTQPGNLTNHNTHGVELNAVYAIARIVAESPDTESGMDAIFRLARTIFIFDVVSLYLYNEETSELEPSYARALGRGRSHEAELDWGEPAALEAFRTGQTVLRQEDAGAEIKGRERRRDYLGLPVHVVGKWLGGLVFGRFGGPSFPPEHIRLAEFVSWHVGQLLESQRMALRIASLEAQRELARMQDEFISTVSHELRSPLGFIKGYVTTLLRDDVEWEEETRHEFLQIMDEEADRLRELIDDLLDSSRLSSGLIRMTYENCVVSTIIRDAINRSEAAYHEMPLKADIEPDLPEVYADSTRIAQVLDNLLSNAAKYAPGSTVTLRAVRQNNFIRIEVIDKGIGISNDHISHLFERFYRVPQTERAIRGTGLGLHICRKIVEQHQGTIDVISKVDEGSNFFFTLPIAEPEYTSTGEKTDAI